MSRGRMACLHAGLVRRAASVPDLRFMPEVPEPSAPFRPLAGWLPPRVVPLRPLETVAPPVEKPRRKAMTVRLEPVRHQRLRAAKAELRRSCQSILVEALECWLAERERGGGNH